jgi:response regulator of citrate/malate metabolism
MTWYMDSSTVTLDLAEILLTPISQTAIKEIYQLNLVLLDSVLPARDTLTFILQVGSSSSSINIIMISLPLHGRITIMQ